MDNQKDILEDKKPVTIFFINKENEKISAFTCKRSHGFPLPDKNDYVILSDKKKYVVLDKTFKFIDLNLNDNDEKIVLEIYISVDEAE